ncbi:integral membrane protein [Botrytis cinerea]
MPGNSRDEAQVIPDSYADHDRTSRPHTTLIMSADCWEQEMIREGGFKSEQHSNRSYPLPELRSHGRHTPPVLGPERLRKSLPASGYQGNTPYQLQFVPYFLWAVFNTTESTHNLAVQVWGDVKGSGPGASTTDHLPGSNDTAYWLSNSTDTYNGKIADEPDPTSLKLTTLFNKVTVLTYEPYSDAVDFCNQLVNGTCPLGPTFNASRWDPYTFPSFGFSNNFYSSYAFTSFTTTMVIKNGDTAATTIGCVSANITPDIGSSLSATVKYIPMVVLLCVAFATAFASIYSPWGTNDIFRWTTNYGRDADLLRLVTPGFGDCLQYIQFVALTGGLTLNYPGFYQPIVTDWNGASDDVWAGMSVWLLAAIGVVLVLIQLGFAMRWAWRLLMGTQEEDLRKKHVPFSIGNVIRIVFNYFLLPIVALSMFQLVEASRSPAYTTGLALLMLIVIVVFAIYLLYLIATARPKSYLFDDLPTVLTYGALYNTYSDNAAPFALVPVLLTFLRGISIGAVQPSGIAQLVLLAICEVITILTLHAFRPFHSPTSMNAYHTFFAAVRFSTILLMIAFAPSLGITEGPKGWVGYAILLMHAIVLILGFLLNALQTIVEVAARLAGAGGNESGAARGGLSKVFGMRQLSRRLPRRDATSRQSQLSSAAMLSDQDRKSYLVEGGRLRSQSAGSAGILLNRQSANLDNMTVDAFGAMPTHHVGSGAPSSYTPTTPGEASTFSFLPSAAAPSGRGRNKGPILGLDTTDTADPYYRPPRFRRPTADAYSPGARSRGSWASGDWTNRHESPPADPDAIEPLEGPSISGRNSPSQQQALDGAPLELNRSKADYTTREVDFYYGVRGPALNAEAPSRRIKTGPADPTGIPASAAGWFKSFFKGKTKEKGKGFEVVRSSRMPPGGLGNARNAPGDESPPEGIPVATGAIRHGPIDSDSDDEHDIPGPSGKAGPSRVDGADADDGELVSPIGSDDGRSYHDDEDEFEMTRISDLPPSLQGLKIPEGGMELPSRFPSKASSRVPHGSRAGDPIPNMPLSPPARTPTVPRKSSRRKSQNISVDLTIPSSSRHTPQNSLTSRLPFERSNSHKRHSDISARSSIAPHEGYGHSRNTSFGNFTEAYGHDRPTSVGYVSQHHIHTINPPENNPQYLGSSAELVDGRISASSSIDHSR